MLYPTQRKHIFPILFIGFLILSAPFAQAATLFTDNFNRPDGIITSEYDFWNNSFRSADWELDSGSFFIQNNQGWSGSSGMIVLTGPRAPNCPKHSTAQILPSFGSTPGAELQHNVKVAFEIFFSNGLISTQSTPPVAWDGIHIFLRYQSEYNLYYASINRREQTAVLKKKCPGGTDNGGTYYELTQYVPHSWSPGVWQHVYATVQTNADNTVTIALYDDNGLVVQGIDNNIIGKCAPITTPGAVGIRGDNNNFLIDDFTVTDLASSSTPALTLTKSASPTSAASGSTVTFTIQYQNTGSASATNAVISDVIPAGSTLVARVPSVTAERLRAPTTWNLGTVAANASGSVNFKVTVN